MTNEMRSPDLTPRLPPAEPYLSPALWIRRNLFSSLGSTAVTTVSLLFAFWLYRGLLTFAFHNPARTWAAVPTNIRLLMTQSYPVEQYVRVWVSLGILVALAGLTLGLVRSEPPVLVSKLLRVVVFLGIAVVVTSILIPNNIRTGADGEFLRDAEAEVLRVGRAEAIAGRGWVLLAGGLLIALAVGGWRHLGERGRYAELPLLYVLFGTIGIVVASLWVVPYGNYGLLESGEFIAEAGRTVAFSTKMPWTVIWILLGLAYGLGRLLPPAQALKISAYLLWLIVPYVIVFVVLRDPALDYGYVVSTDIPIFLGFSILGGLILWLLSRRTVGEKGRIFAATLLLFAVTNWIAAFFGWYPMLQKVRLSFLLLAFFAMAAPNFVRDRRVRVGFVASWVAVIAVLQYLMTMANAESTLTDVKGASFIGGFALTLTLTVFSLSLAFPVGIALALARTSDLPIFRLLATTFIESIRGIPLITVLFFFATMLPLFLPQGMAIEKLVAAILGLALFSGAYVAENIRGGLQSIQRGQIDASNALGLSTSGRTFLVVLPQAIGVSIPALVGQAIATFKETSLIAIIGLFDFLLIGNTVIPAQSEFRGARFEPLIFICVVYWLGTYTMSRYSQSLERRQGVNVR